ncbi:haloacid dehalogenase-like hydrolase [Echinicola sp. CAU 1574]|uniref:Haloacid dehalogenase-like hydrolase n=1 Tax=Echinicola arenosa TaxID=2774144 RepID=A0ABR9AI83_9BACT|nr:HAD family hydrolase [Echinicola arenosa]MBD8487324.1 haloacid dehalogenase-like hydrolase [Echinicola arenosa]
MKRIFILYISLFFLTVACSAPQQEEGATGVEKKEENISGATMQLASWEQEPRKRILEWVEQVTDSASSSYIPASDRIAVFDNDGTLWTEQPIYFQVAFAIDEIKRMAPDHPEWSSQGPFKPLLEGDLKGFMAGGEKSLGALLATTHTGMNTEEFNQRVKTWMQTATHPVTGKHYNEMIFQPMLELLDFLRSNGFKTFIVSGGGIDFMRVWAEEAYGIPPYQIVGSMSGLSYEMDGDQPILNKLPELFFNDDKAGKPVGIARNIGKRPVFAAGNSDGDYEMLQYTSTGSGERFGMYIHHTDSVRESAYDRESHIGQLNRGLDDADKYNWMVVDMAKDWKVIYPYELK